MYFWKSTLSVFLDFTEIPPAYHETIIKALTKVKISFSGNQGLSGWIVGTVTSGDPLKTTLGNTL